MSDETPILAIDQGTTSTRAILFARDGRILASAQKPLPQSYPKPGWVEQEPETIWNDVRDVAVEALRDQPVPVCVGITNQRETTVVWDRETGEPVHPAIVWQDRRTADRCKAMQESGLEDAVVARTGLVLDPYFSATKLAWILENTPGAIDRARRGELAFGTIDSFLVWRMTGGTVHATDATNASRTSLFDIHRQSWDLELLSEFGVPWQVLPEVRDSAADYGNWELSGLGLKLPIRGVAGDQQAATVGQACLEPGMLKSTYGTGCFMMLNTGGEAIRSRQRLLTTTAYRVNGETTYALEGSIFSAGSTLTWLREQVGVPTDEVTGGVADAALSGLYMVPALTGLGAPYWNPRARGGLFGMSLATGSREIVRAALAAVAYQTNDLVRALARDQATPQAIRVDGGMVVNDRLLQDIADICRVAVERPAVTETTAFGAACLAGLGGAWFGSLQDLAETWCLESRVEPALSQVERDRLVAGWDNAVEAVIRVAGA